MALASCWHSRRQVGLVALALLPVGPEALALLPVVREAQAPRPVVREVQARLSPVVRAALVAHREWAVARR